MTATITNLKDTKLDKLAFEITTIITDAKEAESEAANRKKLMPWNVGALLAEARSEFPSDEQYGKWIVTGIIPKIPVTKSQETFTNYKNLSINFSHLRPEIETFKVTALYELSEWAKANPSMTLDQVKAELAAKAPVQTPGQGKPKHVTIGKAAIKGEYGTELTVKQARTLADKHVKPVLDFKIDQYKTIDDYSESELDAIKIAYLDGYAAEHPEEVEAATEQAANEFLANSKASDPVKSLESLKAKLHRQYKAQVQKEMSAALVEYRAKVKEEVSAEYNGLWAKIKDDRAKIEKGWEKLSKAEQGFKAFMSREEFKLITGALHDDKYPGIDDAQKKRINKAFHIMQRLKGTLD